MVLMLSLVRRCGGISLLSDPYMFSLVVSGKLFFFLLRWLDDHCNDYVVICSERIFNAPSWWFTFLVGCTSSSIWFMPRCCRWVTRKCTSVEHAKIGLRMEMPTFVQIRSLLIRDIYMYINIWYVLHRDMYGYVYTDIYVIYVFVLYV